MSGPAAAVDFQLDMDSLDWFYEFERTIIERRSWDGQVQAWANGRPVTVAAEETTARGAVRYRLILDNPIAGKVKVALRIEPLHGYYGGVWYRKKATLSPLQVGSRVMLDLGRVVATAEVRVNGQSVGIRVAPPWHLDITEFVKVGENRLEILVYNTLANHYRTVPTRYRGNLESGLMGPVRLKFLQEVTLTK